MSVTRSPAWPAAVVLGLLPGCPTPQPALPPEGGSGEASAETSADPSTAGTAGTSGTSGGSTTGPAADSDTSVGSATTGEPATCEPPGPRCDAPGGPWGPERWPYRRRIDIGSPLSVSLSNAVVPVRLDEGFEYACAGDEDPPLYFVGDGPRLDHEIDRWIPGVGAVVWVRIPVLDAGGTSIVMYYGDPSAAAAPGAGVWSADGLEAVLHFEDDLDDARAEHDGQPFSDRVESSYNDGRIGRALHLEEANVGSRVELSDVGTIDDRIDASRALTVTAWIRPTPNVTAALWLRTAISRGSNAWAMSIRDDDESLPFDFLPPVYASFYSYCGIGPDCAMEVEDDLHYVTGTIPVIDDELSASWHHVALVYEELMGAPSWSVRKSLYVDGALDGQFVGAVPVPWDLLANEGNPQLTIGAGASGAYVFHGDIDEVHIASEAWAPERIEAEYAFASDEGLVDVGSTECR